MNIDVIGLGNVGLINALCLARSGHRIRGVDVAPDRVAALSAGVLPISEAGLEKLFESGRSCLSFAHSSEVDDLAEVCIVCVGTPGLPSGEPDLSQLISVARSAGRAMRGGGSRLVVLRSTVPPGTTESTFIPVLEKESGRQAGIDFQVAYYPEFLREGNAIQDFPRPVIHIAASTSEGDVARLADLYRIDRPLTRVEFKLAELAKYALNSYNGLRVAFANEIGSLSRKCGVDGLKVLDLLRSVPSAYLSPGAAFGGPCLPKDIRALSRLFSDHGLSSPLVSAILASNENRVEELAAAVGAGAGARIGVFGISFKPGTDDLRESPMLQLIERLVGARLVGVHDSPLAVSRLRDVHPEWTRFFDSGTEMIEESDTIILGPKALSDEESERLSRFEGGIFDLGWHTVSERIRGAPGYLRP